MQKVVGILTVILCRGSYNNIVVFELGFISRVTKWLKNLRKRVILEENLLFGIIMRVTKMRKKCFKYVQIM